MPNAKVLSEKQAIVAALTEKLQGAAAGVIIDYKGINVAEDTALRVECRNNNIDYSVVKNTLLRFAFNNVGLSDLDEQLNAFKAYWLIMAVFHEVKSSRPIRLSAPHIREKIEATGVMKGIHLAGLPTMAKAFMLLLKLRLYRLTLLASALVNKKRES